MAEKTRLDHLLVERGLAQSGSQAQALVMARLVSVDGQLAQKSGTRVSADARVELQERLSYVSRGGLKLEAALDAFRVPVASAVCADVGASTGGFTDCLLQRGAVRVYAIDVGYGQLAWKIRQDERVVVMERSNARHLELLPESIQLLTIDVSFISLGKLWPVLTGWLSPDAHAVPLIKPQFEAGRAQVGKGGVVRDPAVHRQVLEAAADQAMACGLWPQGLIRSPITGPAGNLEFLMHLRFGKPVPKFDLSAAIEDCVEVESVDLNQG